MAIIPIAKMVNIMMMIQSVSPIDTAAKSERNWLFVLAGWIVISALITGVLTVLLYKKTGQYQEAVHKAADARIAEAGTRAATANAEAAKANEGLGKSNVEIARLTTEAEKAKAERAEADKQIAIAKADAARAKEGIANAEAVSAKASVEVSRLQVVVANAEQKRAEAERALLELQERTQPRRLTAKQRADFVKALRNLPDGAIDFGWVCIGGDEAFAFSQQIFALFKEARWTVRNEASIANHLDLSVVGIGILVRGPAALEPGKPPPPAQLILTPTLATLQSAFKSIGMDVQFINMGPGRDEKIVEVVIGSKPRP